MQATMTKVQLRLESLSGEALRQALPALARLRIVVFRDWPYLYDGDAAYEERYLATYAASPGAAVIAAFNGAEPVGMATCQPMAEAAEPVQTAFRAHGLDPARFCYFGESVLLPQYRGQGAGVRFFGMREDHARRLSLPFAAFCAVEREENDPRKPNDYVPLHGFWRKRGFVPYPSLSCVFEWKEVGANHEAPHRLTFWLKSLAGEALP